jgi:hypothetical protein
MARQYKELAAKYRSTIDVKKRIPLIDLSYKVEKKKLLAKFFRRLRS